MIRLHKLNVLVLIMAMVATLFSVAAAQATPKAGGILRVAITGDPPGLDSTVTTSAITAEINNHITEMLYAFDGDGIVRPMLAAALPDISADGLTYTIRLRAGVMFHDGSLLDSGDVKASLERWHRLSYGKTVLKNLVAIDTPDALTVVIRLSAPVGILTSALGFDNYASGIYTSEQLAGAGDDPIAVPIGTGPYRLKEWIRGQSVVLERFSEYSARSEEPSGDAGRKNAWLDEIHFISVPDAATRQAGLESGEYDVNYRAAGEDYEYIESSSKMWPWMPPVGYNYTLLLNFNSPLIQNLKLRQAIQATLDMDAIALGAFGNEALYDLNPGVLPPGFGGMYTDAGKALYDQRNPELGRKLLEESGYDGTPIRWITTRDFSYQYAGTLIAVDQLEKIGLKSEVIVRDWATTVETRSKPDAWEIFVGNQISGPEPEMIAIINPGWVNAYNGSPEFANLMAELRVTADPAKRAELWAQAQEAYYEDVGSVRVSDTFLLVAYSAKVHVQARYIAFQAWNTWLE